jgi:hypothetical protein
VASAEAGQWLVAEKGNQKGKIANFSGSERTHPLVRKEIEREEQEEIQKLLWQGKNWFFHVEWF